MIIYGIFFENKTQTQMAEIMGISRQMLSYKLKSTLNKMREMYMNKFFKKFFKIFCICQSHLNFSNLEEVKGLPKMNHDN